MACITAKIKRINNIKATASLFCQLDVDLLLLTSDDYYIQTSDGYLVYVSK